MVYKIAATVEAIDLNLWQQGQQLRKSWIWDSHCAILVYRLIGLHTCLGTIKLWYTVHLFHIKDYICVIKCYCTIESRSYIIQAPLFNLYPRVTKPRRSTNWCMAVATYLGHIEGNFVLGRRYCGTIAPWIASICWAKGDREDEKNTWYI